MILRLLAFVLWPKVVLALQPVELELSAFDDNPRVQVEQDGTLKISPGGGLSLRAVAGTSVPSTHTVLEFESFSLGGCDNAHVLYGPVFQGGDKACQIAPIDHSERWSVYTTLLAKQPENWNELRLDLALSPQAALSLRNARLRPPNPGEFEEKDLSRVDRRDHFLQTYLATDFPARIQSVSLSEDEATISFHASHSSQEIFLAEVPLFRAPDDPTRFEEPVPINSEQLKAGKITLPRHRERDGHNYDRIFSRWQLISIDEKGRRIPQSHARYPDVFPSKYSHLTVPVPANKKGLGGWAHNRSPEDLGELGITAITVNILLNSLLSPHPSKSTESFQWQGRTFHANLTTLHRHDRTFQEAARHNILVDVVLLLPNPNREKNANAITSIMGHPDADPSAPYAMPNMDSQEGVATYGAALHLLAQRYSRPDRKFGSIHNYIVHNEVDAGWSWTNCGEKPLSYFFDLYHRSMRLVDLITRSESSNARPFITLTHHWAAPGNRRFYGSKNMLLELTKWTRAEGDFPWALAYHPYPASLRNPRTWKDGVTFDFDSDRITPRNIEVLDAWMRSPAMLDKGGAVRPIHLSENGFNSPDYSEKSLREQAAGMAYAWKKIQPLSSVVTWQYHNHIDNRKEGGLRIGLRKFPDDEKDPLGRKPIYFLYRDLATDKEDEACKSYLPMIGISSWGEVLSTAATK
ncbi:DUF5722 domain-containing protein [Roseibacillus persicicus]|uniref:DUF5722 domain-containing protein n=1 Tax=Roseibacillus persicicus TaxID=454148 RepID=UPI00280E1CB4|nr:DUF5722 domain-containing protein [Roseibacillus persicicus]MDQ8188964.1 DUF5722 domain-containing protein [Roseibacillus persicicus]